jgi:hypothetical protein
LPGWTAIKIFPEQIGMPNANLRPRKAATKARLCGKVKI